MTKKSFPQFTLMMLILALLLPAAGVWGVPIPDTDGDGWNDIQEEAMGSDKTDPASPWVNRGLDLVGQQHDVFEASPAANSKGVVVNAVKREGSCKGYAVINNFDGLLGSDENPDVFGATTFEFWFRLEGAGNSCVLLQRGIVNPVLTKGGVQMPYDKLKADFILSLENGILTVKYLSSEGVDASEALAYFSNSNYTKQEYKDIVGLAAEDWTFSEKDGWCHVAVTIQQGNGYEINIYVKKRGKDLPAFTTGRVNAIIMPASKIFDPYFVNDDDEDNKIKFVETRLIVGSENTSAMIDEVRVWNMVRSRDQVIATRNQFLHEGNSENIAAYLPFNFARDGKNVYAELSRYGTRAKLVEEYRNGYEDARKGYAKGYEPLAGALTKAQGVYAGKKAKADAKHAEIVQLENAAAAIEGDETKKTEYDELIKKYDNAVKEYDALCPEVFSAQKNGGAAQKELDEYRRKFWVDWAIVYKIIGMEDSDDDGYVKFDEVPDWETIKEHCGDYQKAKLKATSVAKELESAKGTLEAKQALAAEAKGAAEASDAKIAAKKAYREAKDEVFDAERAVYEKEQALVRAQETVDEYREDFYIAIKRVAITGSLEGDAKVNIPVKAPESLAAGELGWMVDANYGYMDGDSDGDGLPDWWELFFFGNLNQGSGGDYDGDGLNNYYEYKLYAYGADPRDANSLSNSQKDGDVDSDGDGLVNKDEQRYGSDPANADTDDDGVEDAVEVFLGSSPIHPMSVPLSWSRDNSAITIGGKALGKSVAINDCTKVVYRVARIMHALHLYR